jgi:hypothetical protein
VAQVKRDEVASGKHVKRRRLRVSTMEGYLDLLELEGSPDAESPMRKLVLAQRRVRGKVVAEKKIAI